jgi:hypothetical protein
MKKSPKAFFIALGHRSPVPLAQETSEAFVGRKAQKKSVRRMKKAPRLFSSP